MEVERKIFGNTLLLAGGQIVAQFANFGFVILFARSFGAQTFGVYSFAMAIGALLSIFVSFGTNALATKEISREPQADLKLIGQIFPLQILAGITLWSTLTVVTFGLPVDPNTAVIIVILALFHIILKWQSLLLSRFQSRQSMQFVATVQACTRVGVLVLGGLAIYMFQNSMIAVASLPASAMLLLLVAYFGGTRRFGAPHFALQPGETVAIIKKAWPFMSILVLAVVYERLGIILLRVFQSDSDVGYFASAERLLVPFTTMFSVFIVAVFPALAKISPDQSLERDALARRFLRVLLVMIFPAATLVYLYKTDIILLLYGEGFKEAIAVMAILAWVIALRGFNAYLSMFCISAGLQTRLSVLKLFTLLVFVTLSLTLIPLYSYLGLAYAIAASELFLAVVMYWSLRRENLLPGLFSILWRPSLCCLVTIVVMIISPTLPLGYRLVVTLATLVSSAFLTGAVRRHDLDFLVRIASSRREPESG